jgi:hypothetical protein
MLGAPITRLITPLRSRQTNPFTTFWKHIIWSLLIPTEIYAWRAWTHGLISGDLSVSTSQDRDAAFCIPCLITVYECHAYANDTHIRNIVCCFELSTCLHDVLRRLSNWPIYGRILLRYLELICEEQSIRANSTLPYWCNKSKTSIKEVVKTGRTYSRAKGCIHMIDGRLGYNGV